MTQATVTPLHATVPTLQTSTTRTVGTTADRIRSFVDRIERVEVDIAERKEDHSEIYKELKAEGFDPKIVRKLIALRKKDPADLAEQAEILRLYAGAAGNEQLALML